MTDIILKSDTSQWEPLKRCGRTYCGEDVDPHLSASTAGLISELRGKQRSLSGFTHLIFSWYSC